MNPLKPGLSEEGLTNFPYLSRQADCRPATALMKARPRLKSLKYISAIYLNIEWTLLSSYNV